MKKAVSLLSLTTPNSNRKRRRLRDTLAQLSKETEISPFPPPRKRPSAEHSLSIGSLLDISNTPDTCKGMTGESKAEMTVRLEPFESSSLHQQPYECQHCFFFTKESNIPVLNPEGRVGESSVKRNRKTRRKSRIRTDKEERRKGSRRSTNISQHPEEQQQQADGEG